MSGMTIAIVFAPDPDLGTDPRDAHGEPRRQGMVIPPGADVIVVYREWGDEFVGGSRTSVISDGQWEHIGIENVAAAINGLDDL